MRGISAHAVVFQTESACAGCRYRGVERFKRVHSADQQDDEFSQRKSEIHTVKQEGGRADMRYKFSDRGTGGFRFHYVHILTA